MIETRMIEAKAANAQNRRIIARFAKAAAPACAPCLHPAGKAAIDYFGLKLVVHFLIRGSLSY